MDTLETVTVTVPNGQSVSDAVDLAGRELVAILSPANLEIAKIGIQASLDGASFFNTNFMDRVANGEFVRFKPEYPAASSEYSLVSRGIDWRAIRWARLEMRAGNPLAPINVSADRVFQLVLRACSIKLSC